MDRKTLREVFGDDDSYRDFVERFNDNHGPTCDEMDAGIVDLFNRRILNKYAYEVTCLDDCYLSIFDDFLTNPDNPHLDESWKPGNRLQKAEDAFLLVCGLWGIGESYAPDDWRHEAAKRADYLMREGDRFGGLSRDDRQNVISFGRQWLREIREELDGDGL